MDTLPMPMYVDDVEPTLVVPDSPLISKADAVAPANPNVTSDPELPHAKPATTGDAVRDPDPVHQLCWSR